MSHAWARQRRAPRMEHGPAAIAAILAMLACWGPASPCPADEPYGRFEFDESELDHWSFKPVRRHPTPQVTSAGWVKNPIDAFVLAELESSGLTPAPAADRRTLLRRLHLDLVGLPPTPEEQEAFLTDGSADAVARVVDDLLARPAYGERWARHWLDVARYAESNGYERDGAKPSVWRYRDWVIDAFNSDKPYDRFVMEQLAGDELEGSDAAMQIATTFLRLGPWDDEPADPEVDRYNQLDDLVGTTTATFMAQTVRCARCHDHKFEPFTQRDYSRLLAVFEPLKRPQDGRTDLDRPVGPADEVAAYERALAQAEQVIAQRQRELDNAEWQIVKRLADAGAMKAEGVEDATAAASGAGADGSGADGSGADGSGADGSGADGSGADGSPQGGAAEVSEADSNQAHSAVAPPQAQALPPVTLKPEVLSAFQAEPIKRSEEEQKLVKQHGKQVRAVLAQRATAQERAGLEALSAAVESAQELMPPEPAKAYIWQETADSPPVTHVLARGDPRQPLEAVDPGVPAILVDGPLGPPEPAANSTGRRRQLAQWLTRSDHPLTARVMVNRIWQQHFGDGLAGTENDFGVMGEWPSHPELLDWLAAEFVDSGWSIKHMHRLIVLSNTYQMSSADNAQAMADDPWNEKLWRWTPRRLEAEAIRDSILVASGQLNPQMGGPGVYPKISAEVLASQSRPGDGWGESSPWEASRRSIYIFVKRTLLVPELEVLDFPDTNGTCEQRPVSTVAPQALTFLNGQFIQDQAEHFADRLAREAAGPAEQIERAYILALARPPSSEEHEAVLEFLAMQAGRIAGESNSSEISPQETQRRALAQFCLVLLNTNEFVYMR